jgi:hypothetical protein
MPTLIKTRGQKLPPLPWFLFLPTKHFYPLPVRFKRKEGQPHVRNSNGKLAKKKRDFLSVLALSVCQDASSRQEKGGWGKMEGNLFAPFASSNGRGHEEEGDSKL